MTKITARDGYEANLIVQTAIDALRAFGGRDLTYGQARDLLPKWCQGGDLTEGERRAVLARFPRECPDMDPGNSGPGW
jgi:hypothetical protein